MARKVITFDERKKTSYPSNRGLYVAEILLLEYCSYGKYPKPSGGYPGLWWFEYGIRDVGHALESLEKRGYLRWAPLDQCLSSLKVDELKQILDKAGLPTTGKKVDLVKRISVEIPREKIGLPDSAYKYELTDLRKRGTFGKMGMFLICTSTRIKRRKMLVLVKCLTSGASTNCFQMEMHLTGVEL